MIAFWLTNPAWFGPTIVAFAVVFFPHKRIRDWWWARRYLRNTLRDIHSLPATCERDKDAA